MNSDLPTGHWVRAVAVVVVGLNLRGPIVAVAPVLDDVQSDLQVSAASAGLLTSVPVLCFAVISPFVSAFARKVGMNMAVALSLVVLAAGIVLRPWTGFWILLAGTVFIGAAIAVGNVLIPVTIRRDFPARPEPVLSASTTSLIASATIPALITAPLASVIGWRAALAVWAVPVVVALLIWAGQPVIADDAAPSIPAAREQSSAWRAAAAWELGLFFGAQALLFYAVTAWLPTILRDDGGLDAAAAGTGLSLFQLLGIAGAIAVPVLLRQREVRYAAAVALPLLWIVFFAGLVAVPGVWVLWCVLGGIAQGGCLAMALSLIAIRSSSAEAARNVSAMVQTVGYSLGATGPVVIGAVSAATSGWTAPLSLMIGLALGLGVLGIRIAAPQTIR